MKIDGRDIKKIEEMVERMKKLKTKIYRHPTKPILVQTGEDKVFLIQFSDKHLVENVELIPMTGRELSELYKEKFSEMMLGTDRYLNKK